MRQMLGTLWGQFVAAGAPARWAVGVIVAVALAVSGVSLYQSKNPSFEVLQSGLDDASMTHAVSALANAGIRYRPTMPPGPFTIFVESSRLYDAMIAIHLDGNFAGPPRGINSDVSGTSAVFLGQKERDQRSEKRDWQETELQLERLVWVTSASVKVSGTSSGTLRGVRPDSRQASAIVSLRGSVPPDAAQRKTIASIVSTSTGVPLSNVKVSDQAGNMLYDGGDAQSADSQLAMEQAWKSDTERSLQAKLDQVFGAGLTYVGVSGEWRHVHQESVEESLDPAKKPTSKRTYKMEEPIVRSEIGGPAGTFANTSESSAPAAARSESEVKTTNESTEQYSFGQKTTHLISQPHVLERISISLVVDKSIEAQLEQAEKLVKGWALFDLERGDMFEAQALLIPGLTRDDEGKPLLPEPEPPLAAPNPLLRQLLERGIEIAAAIAFLIVLARSLKGANQAARGIKPGSGNVTIDQEAGTATIKLGTDGKPMLSDLLGDEEVDLDLLARKHVEELLSTDPEKVSALLSRWALGEQFYAGTGSR